MSYEELRRRQYLLDQLPSASNSSPMTRKELAYQIVRSYKKNGIMVTTEIMKKIAKIVDETIKE